MSVCDCCVEGAVCVCVCVCVCVRCVPGYWSPTRGSLALDHDAPPYVCVGVSESVRSVCVGVYYL